VLYFTASLSAWHYILARLKKQDMAHVLKVDLARCKSFLQHQNLERLLEIALSSNVQKTL
jgi:hypothetical protein